MKSYKDKLLEVRTIKIILLHQVETKARMISVKQGLSIVNP